MLRDVKEKASQYIKVCVFEVCGLQSVFSRHPNKNAKITSLATNNRLHNLKNKLLESLMIIRIVLMICLFF